MSRPSWNKYFLEMVSNVKSRSTCSRRQFGAIIVNDKKEIISTGYNGVVRGASHCEDIGCVKDNMEIESGMGHGICPAVHAEQNALIQAGKNAEGASMYLNGFPCKICARLIVNSGIKSLVMSGDYSDDEGLKILSKANIEIIHVDMNNGE